MTPIAAKAQTTPIKADQSQATQVLLVEHSRALAGALLASLAEIDGIGCEPAGSLAEVRQLIEQGAERFLVAIACLNLPDAPNGEVVDLLQEAGLPVIVLTGDLDDSRRSRMFERGVADYVSKDSIASIDYVRRAVVRMHANRDARVLVVDDAKTFREYASGLLRQHGYQAVVAADALEGIEMLRSDARIRVVVTDYHMPNMDGLAMVREMRKLRSADDLAIIAISDSTESGVLARFLKSGANDYLRKPFGIEEFYCRIDQNIDMLRAILDARRLANCDFLTGLYNRRYFFEHAGRLYDRARSGGSGLLVAMIDIDHFKRINDTHGHHGGDEALVAVADCLSQRAGSGAIVARFGGEEFAFAGIVDQGMDAALCLEGIRRSVSEIGLLLDSRAVRMTVSIGATEALGSSLDDMLRRADHAVYQAKEQGRDQVIIR